MYGSPDHIPQAAETVVIISDAVDIIPGLKKLKDVIFYPYDVLVDKIKQGALNYMVLKATGIPRFFCPSRLDLFNSFSESPEIS